jgi:hypothetical protein
MKDRASHRAHWKSADLPAQHDTGGAVSDHSRMMKPTAYLGRKPSYDRATFDRIRLALRRRQPAEPIGHRQDRGLAEQTAFRLEQDPRAALDAWGL